MNPLSTRTTPFDDFFRDVAPGFFIRPLHGDPLPSPAQIKVDVHESTEGYQVLAELPGVKKEDIQVSIDGSTVTLRAEVKQEDEQRKEAKSLRSERYYGSVARSFQLPQEVDPSKSNAQYANGVLTLNLPKKAGNTAQHLTIN